MSDNDEEIELPFGVTVGVARLEPNGIGLKITFATSAERFKSRQWDTVVYGMSQTIATALLKGLQQTLDGDAPPPKAPRH